MSEPRKYVVRRQSDGLYWCRFGWAGFDAARTYRTWARASAAYRDHYRQCGGDLEPAEVVGIVADNITYDTVA